MMRRLAHLARTYPTLLRIGLSEAVAYRAEFVIWMLTTTLPLVMLALWSEVTREAPFGRFGQDDFTAYFLGALIVRQLTGTWVVWEMNHEIRTGALSMRLLRPIHPFVSYSAEHLAAVPLRALLAVPIAVIMLITTDGARFVTDPVGLVILPVSLIGAWLIMFLSMVIIGTLGLFIEKSVAIFELWLGLFAVLSGYLVPLELLPGWLSEASRWLPFRYILGFPVELMIGMTERGQALRELAIQWTFVAALAVLAPLVWRAGVRRFEAYGA